MLLVLAVRSLRFRIRSFAATLITFWLGATIVMSFASLLDVRAGTQTTASDDQTLFTMAGVVGGWGVLLVAFAVASTLTQSVRQRADEIALLKGVGATPAQVGRLIVGEAIVLASLAVLAAIVPAAFGGALLLDVLQDSGQVRGSVPPSFGPIAVAVGLFTTLVSASIASLITVWRTVRRPAAAVRSPDAVGPARIGRRRIVAAAVLLFIGVDLAVVTTTVFRGEGPGAMQTAGPASIWFAAGLALLSPILLRTVTTRIARPLVRLRGVTGMLAAEQLRQRTQELASAVMPIVLFTGIAAGTLSMQLTENSAQAAAARTVGDRNGETANLVVVGMIGLFTATLLVSTLVTAVAHRRREIGQQRLIGATPRQVLELAGLESIVLALTGVLAGSLAALPTAVSFAIARIGGAPPPTALVAYVGVVGVAIALTILVTVTATRRELRSPALDAATARGSG